MDGLPLFSGMAGTVERPLFSLPLYLVGTLLAGKMIPGIQLRRPHSPKKMTMFFVTLAL